MTQEFTENGQILAGGTIDVSLADIQQVFLNASGNIATIPAVAGEQIELVLLSSDAFVNTVSITTDVTVISKTVGLENTRSTSQFSVGSSSIFRRIRAPENTSMVIEATSVTGNHNFLYAYKYVR